MRGSRFNGLVGIGEVKMGKKTVARIGGGQVDCGVGHTEGSKPPSTTRLAQQKKKEILGTGFQKGEVGINMGQVSTGAKGLNKKGKAIVGREKQACTQAMVVHNNPTFNLEGDTSETLGVFKPGAAKSPEEVLQKKTMSDVLDRTKNTAVAIMETGEDGSAKEDGGSSGIRKRFGGRSKGSGVRIAAVEGTLMKKKPNRKPQTGKSNATSGQPGVCR